MSGQLFAALSRALLRNLTDGVAHSHGGSLGSASVCRDPRCLARTPH